MAKEYLTKNSFQTKLLGENMAKELLKSNSQQRALVLGLTGDLGGGKTTFLQGFAKGLGINQRVLSPTFIIMRRIGRFYHIDGYRIKNSKELLLLGFKKIINDPKNIVAVEWADRVSEVMPKSAIWLGFEFVNDKTRRIVVK